MDGGGRLDRSLRSPGSRSEIKSDLKVSDLLRMAAIGAGILLREQIAKLKRARAERLDARAKNPNRAIVLLERHVPRRLGTALTLTILGGSAAFGVIRGGHADEAITACAARGQDAVDLQVAEGTPILQVERRAQDILGRLIERRLSLYLTTDMGYMVRLD